MEYVVKRPGGRWEIRESVSTDRGPRARTLGSFRRFTPAVLKRAVAAATRPTSSEAILEAATRAGAVSSAADAASQALLAEVAAGRPPSPGLRRLVLTMLSEPPAHDPPGAEAAEW